MDKNQIFRLLVQLVDRGLVQRQVDSKDRRSQQLSLTEEGKALLDQATPRAIDWEEQLIASLEIADSQRVYLDSRGFCFFIIYQKALINLPSVSISSIGQRSNRLV